MRKLNRVLSGRTFWKNEDGSTAIEFSMLVMPFVLITVGIIELSLMFTSMAMLENATSVASRQIRTGEIQRAAGSPAEQEQAFRDALCAQASILIPCEDIILEVRDVGAFGGVSGFAPTFDDDGNMESGGFETGGVSDVMMIRTFFRYDFATPLIGDLLGEGGTGTRSFMSTVVIQNEPYEF